MRTRVSTAKNYLSIWRQFNRFVIRLDVKPSSWEDRASLFVAQLIEDGLQSSTVKSYVSAIKRILIDDGYQWNDSKILLAALTRVCRLINDRVRTRFPIQCGLLELILFEVQRHFLMKNQVYLVFLYQAIFILGYYGLMRVGELTQSEHTLKAKDMHLSTNREKLKIVLYTSKTHDEGSYPQNIYIRSHNTENATFYHDKNFCPFKVLENYLVIRNEYDIDAEQFFIFRDGSPVRPDQARAVLKLMLSKLGLNPALYDMHSMRIGRCSDLVHKFHYSVDEVKWIGHWKSSCIYRYIRT